MKYKLLIETKTAKHVVDDPLALETPFDLFRVEALVDIPRFNVKKGDIGGWVDQQCYALFFNNPSVVVWVGDDSILCGDVRIKGSYLINGTVRNYILIRDNSILCGNLTLPQPQHHQLVSISYNIDLQLTDGSKIITDDLSSIDLDSEYYEYIQNRPLTRISLSNTEIYPTSKNCILKGNITMSGKIKLNNNYLRIGKRYNDLESLFSEQVTLKGDITSIGKLILTGDVVCEAENLYLNNVEIDQSTIKSAKCSRLISSVIAESEILGTCNLINIFTKGSRFSGENSNKVLRENSITALVYCNLENIEFIGEVYLRNCEVIDTVIENFGTTTYTIVGEEDHESENITEKTELVSLIIDVVEDKIKPNYYEKF